MTEFTTKDSGVHQEYTSGMKRDSQDGKPRFGLMLTKLQPYDEQMLTRYAALLARGAEKYSSRNWEEGDSEEELERAEESLFRHTMQLLAGETDEDHAAAVWFNTQAVEYFRWRIEQKKKDPFSGTTTLHFDGSAHGPLLATLWGEDYSVQLRGNVSLDTSKSSVQPFLDAIDEQVAEMAKLTETPQHFITGDREATTAAALQEYEAPPASECCEGAATCQAHRGAPDPEDDYTPTAAELAPPVDDAEQFRLFMAPKPSVDDTAAYWRKKHQDQLNAWHNRPSQPLDRGNHGE